MRGSGLDLASAKPITPLTTCLALWATQAHRCQPLHCISVNYVTTGNVLTRADLRQLVTIENTQTMPRCLLFSFLQSNQHIQRYTSLRTTLRTTTKPVVLRKWWTSSEILSKYAQQYVNKSETLEPLHVYMVEKYYLHLITLLYCECFVYLHFFTLLYRSYKTHNVFIGVH